MFKHKKSLGQNFLTDRNIIKKILSANKIKSTNILEIGPGDGALTFEILKNDPKSLVLIEKDKNLCEFLKKKINSEKVIIYNHDILNFEIEDKLLNNSVVFGNLPYNISTQILMQFIKLNNWLPKYFKLIFMFQREVAEKIIAKVSDKNYGRISVISSYRLNIKKLFIIKKNSFFPKPKVDSMLLEFSPIIPETKIKNIKNLEMITHLFFSKKRKIIRNSFKKLFKNYEFYAKKLNIDLNVRPSNLAPDIYYLMTKEYENNLNSN